MNGFYTLSMIQANNVYLVKIRFKVYIYDRFLLIETRIMEIILMSQEQAISFYKTGMSKFVQQDFNGAINEFKEAILIKPDYGDVYQAMAHCYEKLEDFDSALKYANHAVEYNPGDFLAHTSLSMFYQRKGLIAEAEKEKELAAKLQKKITNL